MLEETVLLVEDDPETLDIMAAVLRDAGYSVLVAAHEGAALAQLAAHAEIAVIVTDACFGDGSSGLCMAENVRSQGSMAPIVVTSSNPDASCATLGAAAVILHKPYGRAALLEAVAAALGRSVRRAVPQVLQFRAVG
ncbi:MAG: response regulator [Rhodanobacter sp.]